MDKEKIRERRSNRQNTSGEVQPVSEEMEPAGCGRGYRRPLSPAVDPRKGKQRAPRARVGYRWLELQAVPANASKN